MINDLINKDFSVLIVNKNRIVWRCKTIYSTLQIDFKTAFEINKINRWRTGRFCYEVVTTTMMLRAVGTHELWSWYFMPESPSQGIFIEKNMVSVCCRVSRNRVSRQQRVICMPPQAIARRIICEHTPACLCAWRDKSRECEESNGTRQLTLSNTRQYFFFSLFWSRTSENGQKACIPFWSPSI